ncbi:MAG: isoaspartyl peptidase/L-asparaginase [candidate division WOR-3 bacterium]
MPAIIVNGGAGSAKGLTQEEQELARKGVRKAAEAGYFILAKGGKAIDAVVEAVRVMEDDPIFNAGTGSTLTINGEVEMDASLMTMDGHFGAVGAIKEVRNPILVARRVMEETDHLLLVGEGAIKFARYHGFERYDPTTERAKKKLAELKQKGESPYFSKLKKYLDFGTVGAVAIDKSQAVACANSSGGIRGKLPGRVGDSAIIGAGTYASVFGAAVATGHGESIMKLFLAKTTVDLMKVYDAQTAIELALKEAKKTGCLCGIIGIDVKGNIGFGKTTDYMAWASIKDGALLSF